MPLPIAYLSSPPLSLSIGPLLSCARLTSISVKQEFFPLNRSNFPEHPKCASLYQENPAIPVLKMRLRLHRQLRQLQLRLLELLPAQPALQKQKLLRLRLRPLAPQVQEQALKLLAKIQLMLPVQPAPQRPQLPQPALLLQALPMRRK